MHKWFIRCVIGFGSAAALPAFGANFGTQELNRKHGFFLSGGTLSALSASASQARAGWHTPLLPGLRWGVQVSSLLNSPSGPGGSKGDLTYYHAGPTLSYEPYSWGAISTGVSASFGLGRTGYRMQEDNEYLSSGVKTLYAGATADYDQSEKLKLSIGWQWQRSSGIALAGISNSDFSGFDGFIAITTYR